MIYAILAAVASGILGAMGMGGGGILMIYLTVFAGLEQSLAQGINLLFFIPSAIIAILIYTKKKMIDYRTAIPFAISGVAGALLGSFISGLLRNEILSVIFGVFLIVVGLRELFTRAK
ncbi:MAG: sulfite exporter TauE/SafE family protein [Clostridia bacterium]|nr:sulfite exporter TauE/SafE family protein [Clostridia bacterium]